MDRRTVIMGLALAGSGARAAGAAAQWGAENPLIAAFAKTLSAHDIDGFAALFAEDYVNHQISAAAPTPAPGVSPKQATVGFFEARLKGMPDLSVAKRSRSPVGTWPRRASSIQEPIRVFTSAWPRLENTCASRPVIFFEFATARSRNIGAWAILPARSPN
jgi:hypothetical protein